MIDIKKKIIGSLFIWIKHSGSIYFLLYKDIFKIGYNINVLLKTRQ